MKEILNFWIHVHSPQNEPSHSINGLLSEKIMGKNTNHTILDNFCLKWPPERSSLLLKESKTQVTVAVTVTNKVIWQLIHVLKAHDFLSSTDYLSQEQFLSSLRGCFKQVLRLPMIQGNWDAVIYLVNSALIRMETFVTAFTGTRQWTCSVVWFLTRGTTCCARQSRSWNWKVLQHDNMDAFTKTNN